MVKRIISGAVIIAGLTFLVWLDLFLGGASSLGIPGLITVIVTLAIAMTATSEVLWLQDSFETKTHHWLVYVATFMVVASAFVPMFWREYPADCQVGRLGWLVFGVAAATGLILTVEMHNYRKPGSNVLRISLALMIVCYVGLLLSFIGPLRLYHNNQWGMVALLSMIIPTKASDVFAYFIGKQFGRHQFTPILSPGKTYEGVAGSVLGGLAGTFTVFLVALPLITGDANVAPWWALVLFSVVVTSLGIIGDLIASILKRDGGKKDSSRWLPGLGGVLDIIDSPLAVTPAVFAFWSSGLLGP